MKSLSASKYNIELKLFDTLTFHREIIDESDVYIDVHKAIRRLAPAPKASRVPKGHIVADPDVSTIPEDKLVDISEEPRQNEESSERAQSSMGHRADSPANFGSSPKTTFMMRRRSSGAEHSSTHVPVRGNANDMREHLKHLGPSNLASRPKQTRYNTVKIKPAPTIKGGDFKMISPVNEEPYRDIPGSYHGGEGEGLLKSAGKEASDGVHALQQGYGATFAKSPDQGHKISPRNFDGPSSRRSSPPRRPSARRSPSDESSSDTLGSLRSKEDSPIPKRKGGARSGSITENIVDTGGVRKVVLETNSSSDPEDADGSNEGTYPHGSNNNKSRSSLNVSNGQHKADSHNDVQGEDVKKKKKRRRNRKGGKGDEDGAPGGSR